VTGGTGEEREPGAGQPAEEEPDEVLADREEGRPRQGWFTRRPLRTRLSILTAVAVTIAVALCAFASFFAARSAMIGEVDQTLRQSASGLNNTQDLEHKIQQACTIGAGGGQGIFGAPTTTPTLILADGTVACPSAADDRALQPGSHEIAAAASGTRGPGAVSSYHDGVTRAGTKVRVYVQSVGDLVDRTTGQDIGNAAVAYTQDLGPVTAELRRLAVILIAVAALVIMGAWAAGLFVARTALKPVDRLTEAVEHIARTEEVGTTIPVEGEDEIARLSESFNSMSTALASSRERQSQLIADAGHELRTPLTSLRTNVELMVAASAPGAQPLPESDRREIFDDVRGQIEELSTLVGDLVELAREDAPQAVHEPVELMEVVERALARARRRAAERDAAVDVTEADQARRDRLDAAQSAKADDAVLIDTTDLTLEQVISEITTLARERSLLACTGMRIND
jgi:two-component system sensor histidine kinase MprB